MKDTSTRSSEVITGAHALALARSASRKLRAGLLLATFLATLAVALSDFDRRSESPVLAAPPLPALAGRCPASVEAASERGRRAEASARAKIARYPFAPADGLQALKLLMEAESCFALSRDAAQRARVGASVRAWHARLERDYRDHLTRYTRAIAASRPALALRDIAFLLELLSEHDGPFSERLRHLQRELEAPAHVKGEP
jgi:hypothetical protein